MGGCNCGLCQDKLKGSGADLLIIDDIVNFAEEAINAPEADDDEGPTPGTEENPLPHYSGGGEGDDCGGCNADIWLDYVSYSGKPKLWQYVCDCYYCTPSYQTGDGHGHQMSGSDYCQECDSCMEHCTHPKKQCPHCSTAVVAAGLNKKWCNDFKGCYACCGKHGSSSGGGSGYSEKYGKTDTPGWVVRGLKVTIKPVEESWDKVWKVDNKNLDLVQSMADFYLLEYVASGVNTIGVPTEFMDEEIAHYQEQARQQHDDLIAALDPSFQEYIDMAVGGEIRYHRAFKNQGLGTGDATRTRAWVNWKQIRDQVGPDALLDAANLSRELGERTSVLGVKWAIPAEILYERITGKLDPRTFVDRAFALQHNGGSLFNKIEWVVKNKPRWNIQAMSYLIGPAHAANPIKWGPLMAAASPEVASLVRSYWTAANKVRRPAGKEMLPVPSDLDGLEVNYEAVGFWGGDESRGSDYRQFFAHQPEIDDTVLAFVDLDELFDVEAEYADISTDLPIATLGWDCPGCDLCKEYRTVYAELAALYGRVNNKVNTLDLSRFATHKQVLIKAALAKKSVEAYQSRRAKFNLSGAPGKCKPKKTAPSEVEKQQKLAEGKVWKPGGAGGGGTWIDKDQGTKEAIEDAVATIAKKIESSLYSPKVASSSDWYITSTKW